MDKMLYSFLPVIFVVIFASLLGYVTLRKRTIVYHLDIIESYFLTSTVGLIELSILIFILLLLHLFYSFIYVIVFLGLVAYVVYLQRKNHIDFKKRMSKKQLLLLLFVFAMYIIVVVPLALHPPIAWDSIEVHLPDAKMYASLHFLKYNIYLREDFYPHATEMLFALVYQLFSNGIAVQLLVSYFFLQILFGVLCIGKRVYGYQASIIAVGLILGLPMSLWLSSIAYTDMFLTLLIVAATFLLAIKQESINGSIYVLSGLLLGGAIGTKQTAGVYWLILIAGNVYLDMKSNVNKRKLLHNVIYHFSVLLLVAGPWYIRSWILTGNPVYPFATSILGNTGPWSNTEIIGQLHDYNGGNFGGILFSVSSLKQLALNNLADAGLAHPFSLIFILGLILSVFTPPFWSRVLQKIMLVSVLYFAFIAFETVHLRYIFPIIPILAVISSFGMLLVVKIVQKVFQMSFSLFPDQVDLDNLYIRTVIVLAVFFASAFSGLEYTLSNLRNTGFVVTGSKEQAYLETQLPSFTAFKYLNNRFGSNYKVYGVHLENMHFYCDGQLIGDWFGPDSFDRVLEGTNVNETNVDKLKALLTDQKIDFLIVNSADIKVANTVLFSDFNLVATRNGFDILTPRGDLR